MPIAPNNIAEVILSQLVNGSVTDPSGKVIKGSHAMMCWGANKFKAIEKGLMFYVSGLKFKGWVSINYNEGSDLYDVRFGRMYKGEFLYKDEIERLFFEDLVPAIDRFVESGE